ncbi:MAG: SUMF1/EgtB/PvdO family nonheme iron enzyme [Pseudomonadota bacterium]
MDSVNSDNSDNSGVPSYHHDWMTRLVKSQVFRQLPPANIRRIVSNLHETPRRKNDVIARQGDVLDHFVVVKSGQCNLFRDTAKGPQKLSMLHPGDYFGSISLLADRPNGITLTMETDGELLLLPKEQFTNWMFEFLLTRAIGYRRATEFVQKGALWIDVRGKQEYEQSHLPHSLSLPLNHLYLPLGFLQKNLKPLRDKKAFIFYSDSEQRASAAVFRMMEQGKQAFMLAGGYKVLSDKVKTEKTDSEFLQQQQLAKRKQAAIDAKKKALLAASEQSQRQSELRANAESANLLAQVRAEAERLEQEKLARVEAEKNRLRNQRAKLAEEKERLEEEKRKERQALRDEFKEQLRAQQVSMEMDKIKAEEESRLLKLQRDVARAVAEQEEERQRLDDEPLRIRQERKGLGLSTSIAIGLLFFGIIGTLWFSPLGELVFPTRRPNTELITVDISPNNTETTQASSEPADTTTANAAPPEPLRPLGTFRDTIQNGAVAPAMVKLPGGIFIMGSAPGLPYPNEQPAVNITLEPFSISRHEITFEEYDLFARTTGRRIPRDNGWGRGKRPVINVSWEDAAAYTQWLSIQTGQVYRLPSEREWEYAASAGTRTPYWWGEELGSNRANCGLCGSQWDASGTAPVGSFPPNPFGLFDVIGNIREWTQTCPYPNYRDVPKTGNLYEGGRCDRGRVARGGSFQVYSEQLRVTYRASYATAARSSDLGFRIVRQER